MPQATRKVHATVPARDENASNEANRVADVVMYTRSNMKIRAKGSRWLLVDSRLLGVLSIVPNADSVCENGRVFRLNKRFEIETNVGDRIKK